MLFWLWWLPMFTDGEGGAAVSTSPVTPVVTFGFTVTPTVTLSASVAPVLTFSR